MPQYCFIGGRLVGDTNTDGSEYLPFNDDYMIYNEDTGKYVLTRAATKTFLNLDLVVNLGSPTEADQFLVEQSNNVYRELLKSGYPTRNREIVSFKIARTEKGRQGIFDAMLSQVQWAIRFGKDMQEEGISKNAMGDMFNSQLWHKGDYTYRLDTDQKGVGYKEL